jgi:hypothetical protein
MDFTWEVLDFLHAHIGVNPHHRYVVLFAVEIEPVLHVPALVGVEDEHIRLRRALDAFEDLGQGGYFLQIGTDVRGQVGADVRRVADGVGFGNQVRGHARRAQHGRVGLRKVDQKSHGPQDFRRSHAGAPGDFPFAGFGGVVQLVVIVGHEFAQNLGRFQAFQFYFFLFDHVYLR